VGLFHLRPAETCTCWAIRQKTIVCISVTRFETSCLAEVIVGDRLTQLCAFSLFKDVNIFSYALTVVVLEYQTAILRKDFATAASILPQIPNEHRNHIARFLEGLNLKELALEVATDMEHKFELAIQLRKLDVAHQIAEVSNAELKWRQIGDFALQEWKVRRRCLNFTLLGRRSSIC
jgi:hypothetical protein